MGTESRHRRRIPFAAVLAAAGTLALAVGIAPPAVAADADADGLVVMTPERQAHIEQMMTDFVANNRLPGFAMAVVTPDRSSPEPVVTTFAAGYADLDGTIPVDASTQFELGSETKIFTADLLAHLVAIGRVSLDDPIQDFAPPGVQVPTFVDATGLETPITLGDLATHRAGLSDDPPEYGDPATYTQTMVWDAFALPGGQPMWQPGTTWFYSDWGFGLLGTIVSNLVLEGVPVEDPPPFQDALNETFLDALGMASTMLEDDTSPRLAVPHRYDTPDHPERIVQADYWNNTNAMSGGGGLVSTADDMAVFVAAHLGYPTQSPSPGVQTLVDTLQPAATITQCGPESPWDCDPPQFQMGLGWQLYPADYQNVGVPWATKNGGTKGSSTDTALAPSLRIGVTTMFNLARQNGDEIAIPILRYLVEQRNEPKPPAGHGGGGGDDPRRHELAESGLDAAGLAVPIGGAVALLAAGVLLASRRRKGAAEVGD